jgi:NAD(P)-dependent dehydrogenase (short-subunit alcohol dehydrogenase family)
MTTWLITGCSSGIGWGIAEAALKQGDQVMATARRPERLSDLAAQYPGQARVEHLDLTDPSSMAHAVQMTRAAFGPVDVLVNNAGYGYRAAVEESDRAEVDRLFETNVFGPSHLMKLVLPEMRSRRSGTIVNVSSIGAVRAAVGNGFYSATKAALELISDAVAKETRHLGIRVMVVEPGAFRTAFYDSLAGTTDKIDDYKASVGNMYLDQMENHHDQLGDPQKAGEVIAGLVDGGELPDYLPLGSDAVKIVSEAFQARLTSAKKWEAVSGQTDSNQNE